MEQIEGFSFVEIIPSVIEVAYEPNTAGMYETFSYHTYVFGHSHVANL